MEEQYYFCPACGGISLGVHIIPLEELEGVENPYYCPHCYQTYHSMDEFPQCCLSADLKKEKKQKEQEEEIKAEAQAVKDQYKKLMEVTSRYNQKVEKYNNGRMEETPYTTITPILVYDSEYENNEDVRKAAYHVFFEKEDSKHDK